MVDYSFPKITGKHKDFLRGLRQLKSQQPQLAILPIEGTVKLHGIHADIVFDLKDSADVIPRFHSRNRALSPQDDCYGWPKELTSLPGAAAALSWFRQSMTDRYRDKNPNVRLDSREPLIVAGEWIGSGVQRDVGIAALSKRFVILAVSINGSWQRGQDFDDIEAISINIFSIYRAPAVTVMFDTRDLTEDNPALLSMQEWADRAESSCPFAESFDIHNSMGEGIVWRPDTPSAYSDAKFWFKTKGPKSGPENRMDKKRFLADAEREQSINKWCDSWVTQRRIEQGFEYLNETGVQPTPESLKEFQKWLMNDIMVEEEADIEALQQQHTQAKAMVKTQLERLTRHAYLNAAAEFSIHLPWFSRFDGNFALCQKL